VQYGHARIVVDARIDNELDLRRTLNTPDATVDELLIRAYLAWGDEFVARLSGDFAFVLWDGRLRRLVAARDPFGVRPLFYRASRQEISLAGSVRHLLTGSREALILDEQRIVEYLLGRYSSRDRTFFRDIKELPAGHLLVAEATNVSLKRYWAAPSGGRIANVGRQEYADEFSRLFIGSVKERLRSDSPVMIHVSGGLDSSSIAGAADVIGRAGDLPAPYVRGVAGLHPGLPCDERPFIDAVARWVQFPIDRWDARAPTAIDLDLSDPSIAQPGIRALYRSGTIGDVEIARSLGASVILTGTGGDELGAVAGFVKDLIANHQWSSALDELFFFPGATTRTRITRLRQFVRQSVPSALLRWRALSQASIPHWLRPGFGEVGKELAVPEQSDGSFSSHLAKNVWERINSARLARVVTQFQEHSSAYGIGYRFPFLDRELISFVLTVPYNHWPRPRAFARLHRAPLAALLPAEIAHRLGKAEFTSALVSRIRNAEPQIRALLDRTSWYSEKYVDPDKARTFCRAVLSRNQENTGASVDWLSVWAIVTVEAWMRKAFGYHTDSVEVS
jgi:asparagine synthase (glutamine-hydrolysing)